MDHLPDGVKSGVFAHAGRFGLKEANGEGVYISSNGAKT